MNLEPTEEQRQIVATVRRFVREEIVPLEAKLDPDASELPAEDFAAPHRSRCARWASGASTSRPSTAAPASISSRAR